MVNHDKRNTRRAGAVPEGGWEGYSPPPAPGRGTVVGELAEVENFCVVYYRLNLIR